MISDGNIRKWKRQYQSEGEGALENKRKSGNPLSKYTRRKELSREEQLEYQAELLKLEFNHIPPVRKLNGKPPVQFRIEQVA